jgi:hypothetical protein
MKSANIFSPSFFITELTTMPRCYMALTIFFILTIIMGIPTSLMWGDMFSYPIWADRALVRSYNLFTDFQFGGSELMTGGQNPGSFYYLLLRCILTFTDNPLIIHRVMLVAYALSVVGCYFLARRFATLLPALCGVAIMVASRPMLSNIYAITNPAFTVLFSVGIWWLMVSIVRDKRPELLPAFTLLVLLTAQINMSYYLLVPSLALAMVKFHIRLNFKTIYLCLFAIILLLAPYFLNEFFGSFQNSQSMSDVYKNHTLKFEAVFFSSFGNFLFTNLGFTLVT